MIATIRDYERLRAERDRLLAERERLVAEGVDPADLEVPLPLTRTADTDEDAG